MVAHILQYADDIIVHIIYESTKIENQAKEEISLMP